VTVLLAVPAAASVFWVHVWIGYLLLPLVLLTAPHAEKLAARPFGEGAGSRPTLISTTAAVILSLCVTHAVFFGAGRYSLVAFPFVTAVAALAFAGRPEVDRGGGGGLTRGSGGRRGGKRRRRFDTARLPLRSSARHAAHRNRRGCP
jgi:hypothetical protein